MPTIQELLQTPLLPGRLEWIGLSPGRREPIQSVERVMLQVGTGLDGDHHARSGKSKRQVTLIQAEHLPIVAGFLQQDSIAPELIRRNLVVSGINLLALKERRFRIGSAILKGSGPCAPCSRMEENLGNGGYAAMRGHGGITAIVEQSGEISVGDEVFALNDMTESSNSPESA
ncbi:MAG TPA: MOSC domain-containing protein [Planctomycetaceae bacterium]|nr:MOSC domain-containing protein [Planctomycetaceae bacterium]